MEQGYTEIRTVEEMFEERQPPQKDWGLQTRAVAHLCPLRRIDLRSKATAPQPLFPEGCSWSDGPKTDGGLCQTAEVYLPFPSLSSRFFSVSAVMFHISGNGRSTVHLETWSSHLYSIQQ